MVTAVVVVWGWLEEHLLIILGLLKNQKACYNQQSSEPAENNGSTFIVVRVIFNMIDGSAQHKQRVKSEAGGHSKRSEGKRGGGGGNVYHHVNIRSKNSFSFVSLVFCYFNS